MYVQQDRYGFTCTIGPHEVRKRRDAFRKTETATGPRATRIYHGERSTVTQAQRRPHTMGVERYVARTPAPQRRAPVSIDIKEIGETLNMVAQQNLDVRTITMGINTMCCADEDIDVMARKV